MQLNATVQFGDRSKTSSRCRGPPLEWHDIEQRFVTSRAPALVHRRGAAPPGLPHQRQGHRPSSSCRRPHVGQYVLVGGPRFMVVGVVETKAGQPHVRRRRGPDRGLHPLPHGRDDPPEPGMYVVAQTKGARSSSRTPRPRSPSTCAACEAQARRPGHLRRRGHRADHRPVQQGRRGHHRFGGGRYRRHLAPRRRHRHHEHHARQRERTHPRDRPAQGRRRHARRHPAPVPRRGRHPLPHGRRDRAGDRARLVVRHADHPGLAAQGAACPSGRSSSRRLLRGHGRDLRHVPGDQGGRLDPIEALRHE
jgi:hypothetical protein